MVVNKRQEARGRRQVIRNYKDWRFDKLSYNLAMEIFWLSKKFPKEERYSLVSLPCHCERSEAIIYSCQHWGGLGKKEL